MQVDYAYGKTDPSDKVNTVLVGIDTQTKMLFAMPLESKGHGLRGQAEALVKFSLNLNHFDMVEFAADSEPTTRNLLESVKLLRQQLGMRTTVSHAKPGEKGRTAQVERAIQTLRNQASTLLHMAEEKCRLRLPFDHALVPWSYVHAAWVLNRFAVHSATKISPFELVHGRRYCGKVACFGEVVMLLHRRGLTCKQGPQWVPGVWLGKTEAEDLHVVSTPNGVLKGKAIRRTADPWRGVWLFMKEKPYKPWTIRRSFKILAGTPAIPLPVKQRHRRDMDEIDYDAQDVQNYAEQHPDTPEGSSAGLITPPPATPPRPDDYIHIPPLPLGLDDDEPIEGAGELMKRMMERSADEPSPTRQRVEQTSYEQCRNLG